eukprot:SAG11_NODE_11327_length_768_cov_1.309417_1_plen_237_part_01
MTLEAAPQSLARCLRALNGAVWGGSRLKIERAKEHYPARIEREAEERTQQMLREKQVQQPLGGAVRTITRLRVHNPDVRGRRRKASAFTLDLLDPSLRNKTRFSEETGLPEAGGADAASSSASASNAADSTEQLSAEAVNDILRQQGFLDSDSGDEAGPANEADPTAGGRENLNTLDTHAEKDQSLDVFSKMFNPDKPTSQSDAVSGGSRAQASDNTAMTWRKVERYDPLEDSTQRL